MYPNRANGTIRIFLILGIVDVAKKNKKQDIA